MEEKIYVTVGKEVSESKATLTWTLHNSGGKRVCILHVHQPAQRIPLMGTKFSVDQLEKQQVRAYREKEKKGMNKILHDYTMLCEQAGVRVDVISIEMDSIEKGIVELISQHNIRKLVMGAAADRGYSKKMLEPKSKKAIYVRLQAPASCQIMFICKGNLVHTREGRLQEVPELGTSINQATTQVIEFGETFSSLSSIETHGDRLKPDGMGPDFRRVKSDINHKSNLTFSPSTSRGTSPQIRPNLVGSFSSAVHSRFSSCSSSDFAEDIVSISGVRSENGSELLAIYCPNDAYKYTLPPNLLERELNDGLYDQLNQAYADAEISRREAFDESIRRSKAEKYAVDAFRKAKISEALFAEEERQREQIEEALYRSKEEMENMKQQVEEVMEELRISLEQKSALENRINISYQMVQELEQKTTSAVDLLEKYKKERDILQVERDDALKFAEEMREKQAEDALNLSIPQIFSEFSLSEIEEATDNFDLSKKIGEGGYGNIYKGLLRHTQVAIKMLQFDSLQGPAEFQQEVNILSKLRHRNLVNLIGACPEACILIYEYYPNGSLEERLSCKNNSPPISWQIRIRIAAELCSGLIFLHSSSPNIVHGDLKPSNILLDAHFVTKLSDFGISRVISGNELSCLFTAPKGTLTYVDPEFLRTGELTVQSDIYSFGIILLRLLTGRPALAITRVVECALENGDLKKLLDPTAGEWPFIQAEQLAYLAMKCCEMNRRARPNLVSEVWRVLDPMRVSCGASSFGMLSEGHRHIPSYFTCPIFQEIMQDPHVAADGFTYELEALKGWLNCGHETSPMTNLKLPNCKLVPNRALRSAIQEWLQQA